MNSNDCDFPVAEITLDTADVTFTVGEGYLCQYVGKAQGKADVTVYGLEGELFVFVIN